MTATNPIYADIVVAGLAVLGGLCVVSTVSIVTAAAWHTLCAATPRRRARQVAHAKARLIALDPLDEHWATTVRDMPWYEVSPMCAGLRADFDRWEQEVSR